MTTQKFKCTLLSDVILNQKAASEGPNITLDFIPGNCFLGIVASKLYPVLDSSTSWEIFHSGNVIFGDAHPSADGIRGLKTPLSMFAPKLDPDGDEVYVYHKTPKEIISQKSLKQIRKGFNLFDSDVVKQVKTSTNYVIKSGYDPVDRKSKDEMMFCYESLGRGLELYFEVVAKDDTILGIVKEALVGRKTVGRSRTAQYGLVYIEPFDYRDVQCADTSGDLVEVYADSRLIFLDEYGLPKFQPTAEEVGVNGEIVWEMTQLRTFQYAPWNSKRKSFDTDRCGIEKGSVFVIRTSPEEPFNFQTKYVGAYISEGFGKVLYNPCFLKAGVDGKVAYKRICNEFQKSGSEQRDEGTHNKQDSILIKYLAAQKEMREYNSEVYKWVNEWVEEGSPMFRSAAFASQWGNIRNIAQQSSSYDELKSDVLKYLTKGVASSKWNERGRLEWLRDILDSERVIALPYRYLQIAIVNLATEMSKKIK